ncbi:succinylglutamate desuccinylase [Sinorhizobium medicae]|nr:succinylglutamate desuccinylase [Sinorhizobium medicae]MDX1238398.1 succinylglutamate desuccinylase [Sinorhizobium medicae]
MKFVPIDDKGSYGEPGILKGHITYDSEKLAGYKWEVCEIRGAEPGPRLCICAGIHPNEVSPIEAAVQLQSLFDPATMRGSISIIPLINQPGLYEYPDYACPLDGKNIEHTFPGRKDGTFSEALCDAIINEWCSDADCLVDMHGGALRENVSKFVMYQRTCDAEFDTRAKRLAECFDAEFVLALPTRYINQELTYSPSAFARNKRISILPEAGANGLLTEENVAFFVLGVQNVAREMGITNAPSHPIQKKQIVCDEYHWVYSSAGGNFYPAMEIGDWVTKGQSLGQIKNFFGDTLAEVVAPEDGYVLWRLTHPLIKEGSFVGAIAPARQ